MTQKKITKAHLYGEIKKCQADPEYFIRHYCYIKHPVKGALLFNLYKFQVKVLAQIQKKMSVESRADDSDQNNIIILKSRQLGISTLVSGYSLWEMIFHENRVILSLAIDRDTATNLLDKIRYMYERLPKWMAIPHLTKNKSTLELKNGSRAVSKSGNPDAARSEAVSILIFDEAAFIENMTETFTAALPTLSTGGKCIALSTPNGKGNWFHQTWVKAEASENSFLPIRMDYRVHPHYDEAWRLKQDKDLGEKRAAQECDADFLSSGDTVFPTDKIETIKELTVLEPIEKSGPNESLWTWAYSQPDKKYMVTADVARGDGSDYSAYHVLDIESCEQVAEYKGKVLPQVFARVLISAATVYNNALLVVENNNIGWSTVEEIINLGYTNLYHSSKNVMETAELFQKKEHAGQLTPGFCMSVRVKPLVIAKFSEYITGDGITIRSKRLAEELFVYVWRHGKPEAQKGYNDDLITSMAMGLYVRDTSLKFLNQGAEAVRSQINSMITHNTQQQYNRIHTANRYQTNPFIVSAGHGKEMDVSWLLGQKPAIDDGW